MTFRDVLDFVGVLRSVAYEEKILLRWLLELEGRMAVSVRGEAVGGVPSYSEKFDPSTPLLVTAPFERVYWTYLVAMIDLACGDRAAYAASYPLFLEAYDEYARWFARHKTNKKGEM
ncbi:MAG: hypothetical protein IJY22_03145 [Clostridia bacterium]|nr:hypothetical protein [Clostridia bacterium]